MTEIEPHKSFGSYRLRHEWLYNLGRAYRRYLDWANSPYDFKPGARTVGPIVNKFFNRLYRDKS